MNVSPDQPDTDNPYLSYRRYFLLAGLLLGTLLSGWYLLALRQQAIANPLLTVDPWFKRGFFVLLIFFASFFQCSLLARLFADIMQKIHKN
jgi:hypothetical protein